MTFDLIQFDTSGWDVILISAVSGLKLMKCQTWAEGSTHGGVISGYEVVALFDDISDSQNTDGHTDYRKCFILASESEVINKTYATALTLPEALTGRITVTMAVGTNSDTYETKPDDTSFASEITCDISSGQYTPVWFKRTISAEPGDIVYCKDVKIEITVTGQD